LDISVVIPAYNGGKTIIDLFLKIRDELSGKYSFEVLFIFDNGMNNTWEIIERLKNDYPDLIKAFHLAKNYGQHRAIQFGLCKTTGNFVVTMDEDLQHDPVDIIRLIEKQKEGNYDIVYGKFNNLQHKGIRNIISTALRKTLKHFIPTLYDNYSPYRLIKQEVALRTSTMICPYTFIDDFLSRVTKNIAYQNINHYKRLDGGSSYTLAKLIKHGIYILLAYSRLISWLLVSSIVFILAGLLTFLIKIISPEFVNYWFINNISIIATFGIGGILIFLSLIGSFINHHNTMINTRPVKLLNEDPLYLKG
jgi:undecaprenyl-phosphate 4-deoxy-4-formamido-L-arabinose transferase